MSRIGLTLNEAKTHIRQAIRLSGIYVRAASLSQGWLCVSRNESVQEERGQISTRGIAARPIGPSTTTSISA